MTNSCGGWQLRQQLVPGKGITHTCLNVIGIRACFEREAEPSLRGWGVHSQHARPIFLSLIVQHHRLGERPAVGLFVSQQAVLW